MVDLKAGREHVTGSAKSSSLCGRRFPTDQRTILLGPRPTGTRVFTWLSISVKRAGIGRSWKYKSGLKIWISWQLMEWHLTRCTRVVSLIQTRITPENLKYLPSTNHRSPEIDNRDRVFLLDKNGDAKISIEELINVMEELGAQGEDTREIMQLLDCNSDGSLSSDEFDLFQKQVELMRSLEDRDDQFKTLLNEKLQMEDSSGLVQAYEEKQRKTSCK